MWFRGYTSRSWSRPSALGWSYWLRRSWCAIVDHKKEIGHYRVKFQPTPDGKCAEPFDGVKQTCKVCGDVLYRDYGNLFDGHY